MRLTALYYCIFARTDVAQHRGTKCSTAGARGFPAALALLLALGASQSRVRRLLPSLPPSLSLSLSLSLILYMQGAYTSKYQ